MKNLLLLITSLSSLNAFANSDRLSFEDKTFIKHSENFEYSCELDLGFLDMTVWVDTDYQKTPYTRVATKVPSVVANLVESKTGQRVVGVEALVLSTQSARCNCLDTLVVAGDYYYGEEAPKKTATYRIYEKADKTVALDYSLYDYDDNNNAVKEVTFTGSCKLNEVY